MKSGIYKNIPFEEYKTIEAVSKSMFKSILRSGKAIRHYLDNEDKSSDAMVFGNLVDTLLLEPDKFIDRYICPPETYQNTKGEIKPWNWNANSCKAWRDDLSGELSIVYGETIDKAKNIVENIKSHPQAAEWLYGAACQVSLIWIDPDTGLLCKGRPDVFRTDCIPDLKITYDCHPKAFSKTVNNFMYHVGAAFYHDGSYLAKDETPPEEPKIPMCFIVAEDKEPFDVVCYSLDIESFMVGRAIYKDALQRYKEFKENDDWPGYSNVCEEISIPIWALNKYQFEGVIE